MIRITGLAYQVMEDTYGYLNEYNISGNKRNISSGSTIFGSLDVRTKSIEIYLKKLNIFEEKNCLVLTPTEHYYYSEEDLKSIKTLVNLKKLNAIKSLKKFLHNLYRILPPDSNFVGCFEDYGRNHKKGTHSDKYSGLLNWFISFLEMKQEHKLRKKDVYELLETHGFRIVDITEINGCTFFYSKNARKWGEMA